MRRSVRRAVVESADSLLDELGATIVKRFGIEVTHGGNSWWIGGGMKYNTIQQAIKEYVKAQPHKLLNGYKLKKENRWHLLSPAGDPIDVWITRPSREVVLEAITEAMLHDGRPAEKEADTLGWRTFNYDIASGFLTSPSQGSVWATNDLRAENWNTSTAVRGASGVHACRLPKGDWKMADRPSDMPSGVVLALVERFGKFVLGEVGWRAEWVIIKELLAHDAVLADKLRKSYPEVPVYVASKNHWIRR